jgi:hypothetical protein
MTAIDRRSLRTLVALGVCVLTPTLLVSIRTSATSAADSSCNALHEWASIYQGTTPTLETFAPFDRAHRRAIFNVLTPDVRSALWREQLRHVAQRPEWSGEQRALIAEAIDLATPVMYARDPVARRAAVEHWTRAQSAFPAAEQRRLLFELGGPTPRPGMSASAPSLWDRVTGPFRASAQPVPWCECSIQFQDCIWCVSPWPASTCQWQWDGCGPYMMFECDGVCDYWQPGS